MRELSLHILDVLQNAVEAGATAVELSIREDREADRLTIRVHDNGRGMDSETARRALDPFFTTRSTRHVGLGLPLFAAAASRCEGGLSLDSAPGQGTTIVADFRRSHWDRAPLGDMPGTLLAFLLGGSDTGPVPAESKQRGMHGETRLCYHHSVDGNAFEFDTGAMRAELGEIPFSHPQVREWLQDYIAEGEAELYSRQEGENHA